MQLAMASLATCQHMGASMDARRGSRSSSQQPRAARGAAVVVRAASMDSKGLFTNSGMLGPKAPGSSPSLGPQLGSKSSKPQVNIDDVQLASKVDVNYTTLRDLLKEGKWREAEDETREVLIQAAGALAVKRGWVYFSEIKFIPVEDMRTMDELWKAASGGKFGYSVQRELWLQKSKRWPVFFKAIDWVQGENNIYRKWPQEFNYSAEAPKGHLPLTNALRGTRLFEAIMEHDAFQPKTAAGSAGSSNGQPGWMQK